MEEKMFCFQCQEAAKGTGCTVKGVCGKLPETSTYIDLLLSVVRGVGTIDNALNKVGIKSKETVDEFIVDGLFATISCANFDDNAFVKKVDNGLKIKAQLLQTAKEKGVAVPNYAEIVWQGKKEDFFDEGRRQTILRNENEDLRSMKEIIVLGLKGIAAYYEHAARLGYKQEDIVDFISEALSLISNPNAKMNDLYDMVMRTGKFGVDAMALLDKANTSTYGNPEITKVNIGVRNNPGILITGHDLKDLEQLLEQTKDSGIDIYTHGEMLSAHYYPLLKKYPHLAGNYGNAWWKQKEEFSQFNGPIIFTTNCIVPPLADANYKDRVFTTNSTGFPGWKHIEVDANGRKDFSEVINIAKTCQPPVAIEQGEIVGGFAHNQVFELADAVVENIKNGSIKKFFVMSGCDGRMKSREYYKQFAESLPKDTIILTSGCAKYKYNKLNLGDINGIPRVLDAGQCNDSYSWVLVALKLQEIFGLASVNDLPIVFNIAWYEQKAAIVLLALLYLGVKNIHIGPTLPAFMSENVRNILNEKFGLGTITTVEEDLKRFLA